MIKSNESYYENELLKVEHILSDIIRDLDEKYRKEEWAKELMNRIGNEISNINRLRTFVPGNTVLR